VPLLAAESEKRNFLSGAMPGVSQVVRIRKDD